MQSHPLMRVQLLKFVVGHTTLVSIAFIILCVLGFIEWIQRVINTRALSATAVSVLISRRQAKIIDLREKPEFLKAHIPKAVHVEEVLLETVIKKQSPTIPIIFVLSSAGPPLKLLRQLRLAGFSELYHLEDGITSWQQAHLPLTNASL